MINLEKLITSLLEKLTFSEASALHQALREQGIEYKDGKLVNIQDNEGKDDDERITNYKEELIRKNQGTMTREDEIKEAVYSHFCNDSAVTFNLQCHCFQKGAEWADSHPRKGLVDIEKVINYMKSNSRFKYLLECDLEILDDLRKAMED